MKTTNAKPLWIFASFAAFVVFVYLFGLTVPLLGPDEPRYAQVAREMFLRGDWVTPTLGGFHWFEKPALLYWLQITFYNLFGVNEFAARFGSALFGLGTIASLWLLGRSVDRSQQSETTRKSDFSTYLALIAASSLGLMVFARGASFDIIVTFPMTAAMVSYFIFDINERKGRTGFPVPLISFYFFIGLAVLAKGLIGIVFPFAIVTFYHLLSRRVPSAKLLLSVLWGIPISAAVVATWYLPMYLRHGWEFVDEFIIQHHFQRFTSNKYQHPQPFHFFWWVLPLMTFPWIPFFFGGIWLAIKTLIGDLKGRSNGDVTNSPNPLILYSLAWLLVPLVFFSFSGSKLPGYILPSLPPAIVITAFFVWQLSQKRVLWRRSAVAISLMMLVLVSLTIALVLPRFAERDSVRSLVTAADERGMSSQRLLMFYSRSHNAEFYAPGRLLRDETERQPVFYKTDDILAILINEPNRSALIISPVEHAATLMNEPRWTAEILKDNTEHAIVAVTLAGSGIAEARTK